MGLFRARVEAFNDRLEAISDEAEWLRLHVDAPPAEATMAAAEFRLGRALPTPLRDWLAANGTAASESFGDVWNTLAVGTVLLGGDAPLTPVAYVDFVWGGRPELFDALSAAQIAAIESGFLMFGQRHVDDNVHVYLLVDAHGAAHALLLDQDDMDDALHWLSAAASSTPPRGEPIDAVIDAQFATVLAALEEDR